MMNININRRIIFSGFGGAAVTALLLFSRAVFGDRPAVQGVPMEAPVSPVSVPIAGTPERFAKTWLEEDQAPDIREVQSRAIQYAEVLPEKIQHWRRQAARKAWVPKLSLSFDRDRNQTIASSTAAGKTSFAVGPEDQSLKLGLGLTWDLAELIWNSDQIAIDTRSRYAAQLRQQILEDVTELYFERKRLLLEFQAHSTADPVLEQERFLRIEEISARLDALTGGYFRRACRK